MSLPPEKASELKQLIHQQLSKVRVAGAGRDRRAEPGPFPPARRPRADSGTCLPRPWRGLRGGQSFEFEESVLASERENEPSRC